MLVNTEKIENVLSLWIKTCSERTTVHMQNNENNTVMKKTGNNEVLIDKK